MALVMELGVSDYSGMADKRIAFARNLDDYLKAHRGQITGRRLAQEVGIGETDLSRIRRGKREPSVELAAKIAQALGVSLDALAMTPAPAEAADPFAPIGELRRVPRAAEDSAAR